MRRRSRTLILLTGMAGCSAGPSHIPPLWQLPGAAISSAVSNGVYDARRGAVKRLVTRDERMIAAELDDGGGPALDRAMDAARIPPDRRAQVVAELRSRPDIYRRPDNPRRMDIEAVTVVLMVYGR